MSWIYITNFQEFIFRSGPTIWNIDVMTPLILGLFFYTLGIEGYGFFWLGYIELITWVIGLKG
jgi:hypothetical protein